MNRPLARTLGVIALAAAAQGCGKAPSLDYRVDLAPDRPDRIGVSLEIHDVPREGLVLRGYGPAQTFRISGLRAETEGGASITVVDDYDPIAARGTVLEVPRFALRGPLPAAVRIRYEVRPGHREGDAHVGYTGRTHGLIADDLAFVSGRNLFLLPQPADRLAGITVRFLLPPGWSAVTPWSAVPGTARPPAAEDLVAAALGMGRFEERSFTMGGTRVRLAFAHAASLDDAAIAAAASLLEKTSRHLHAIFARDLGPDYTVVLLPGAPGGDEIVGEGWMAGQGGTLLPLTPGRLRLFAERLVDAWVRGALPGGPATPAERWIADGLRGYYGWRAVGAAGLTVDREIARSFAIDAIASFRDDPTGRDLESLDRGPVRRATREILAPLVLTLLDREIRRLSSGDRSLDDAIARLSNGRGAAASLWTTLGGLTETGDADWESFRAGVVRGAAPLPVEPLVAMTPTRSIPEPPAGPIVGHLSLAYTGETDGFLENCGCKVSEAGGIARRATILDRLRRADPGLLVLDAGSAVLRPRDPASSRDLLTRAEQRLYLRTLRTIGYRATTIGMNEILLDPDLFREVTHDFPLPYLSSNVRARTAAGREAAEGGDALGARAGSPVILRVGGRRVALIGVFEPPVAREASSRLEDRLATLVVEDPVATVCREVERLERDADLVIALGRLTPPTIREVAAACPTLDVVISTEDRAPRRHAGGEGDWHLADADGFIGGTLVLYAHLAAYGLGSARIGLDREGRVGSATFEEILLDGSVPDHPGVRRALDLFYDRVGRTEEAQAGVRPLFQWDERHRAGRYAGAAVCKDCHEAEFRQWSLTPHADAYRTLLDRHRHYQPRCVSCHVVGFRTPHGFRLGTTDGGLANVQCESCHGAGADHAGEPAAGNIRRRVEERVCLECHTPEHSDHFVYAERLPKVRHGGPGGTATPPPRPGRLPSSTRK